MSSALAMVLTAAMAVPGNGPEMVSAETKQGLDLRGEWKGTWYPNSHRDRSVDVRLDGEWLQIRPKDAVWVFMVKPRDEGDGRASLKYCDEVVFPGIYRHDGDHLIICYCILKGERRPTSFRASDGLHLLILHRIKLRK